MFQIALPGMGYTDVSACPAVSISERCSFLRQFVDALGLQKCWILGHSISGPLAVAMAVADPQRFPKIILLSAVGLKPHKAYRSLPPQFLYRITSLPVIRTLLTPLWKVQFTMMGFPRGITHQTIHHVMACAYGFQFAEQQRNIEALTSPTMVIWSDDDPLIEPHIQQELAEKTPDGPIINFKTGGHNPQKTQAEAIAKAIIGWKS